ncbi:MAG: ATP synthase F1 subunit epsilon [Bacteroidales bacterium]|nr:ATP synthase F1 subunit epsilon [Bacteroidales bacterium]
MNELQLEIITPEKTLYKGAIELVEVPGKRGRFTVLHNHAPIISTLEKGQIRIKAADGKEEIFDCNAGYLECSDNKVSILLN